MRISFSQFLLLVFIFILFFGDLPLIAKTIMQKLKVWFKIK